MPSSKVISFSEPEQTMTIADGLAFIERTRRQLDRFDTALPHDEGKTFDPQEAAEIRKLCDKVEADLNRALGIN
jgi:hypothetical protein